MAEPKRHTVKMVLCLRLLLALVLICCAIALSCAVFVYTDHQQSESFQNQFESDADKIFNSIGETFDLKMGAAESFIYRLVSHAKITNASWPLVTLPDLAVQSAKTMSQINSIYMTFYPLITADRRSEWENYTKYNDGWVEDSLRVQSQNPNFHGPILENYTSSNIIWRNEGFEDVNSPGPFLPSWMGSPVIPTYYPYNWNPLAYKAFSGSLLHSMETKSVVFTSVANNADPGDPEAIAQAKATNDWALPYLDKYEDPSEPFSDMYYPAIYNIDSVVIDRTNDTETSSGVVAVSFYWRHALKNILPQMSLGLVVVFTNPCGDEHFTYRIDGGIPTFLGFGDVHSDKFTDMKVTAKLADLSNRSGKYTGLPMNAEYCPFTVSIYPSKIMEDQHRTSDPILFTCGAALIFFGTSILFFVYDLAVRREFYAKQQLLQAKRHFMRFVSHEVRTPLNAVCLGLTLLNDELKVAIKNGGNKLMNDKNEREADQGKGTPCSGTDENVTKGITPRINTERNSIQQQLDEWLSMVDEIAMAAESSVNVLNDLLNYDKIRMGNFALELTDFGIFQMVEETYNEFRLIAKGKNIDFALKNELIGQLQESQMNTIDLEKVKYSVEKFHVVGDEVRLKQVLRNVLSNALKFTPEDGKLTVRISSLAPFRVSHPEVDKYTLKDGKQIATKRFGMLLIEVIDTGVGLSEDQMKNLFQDGVQFNVNELQSGQGTGLGLFISRGIISQHRGDLKARSNGLGCGSTFTIELPLYYVSNEKDHSCGPKFETSNVSEIANNSQSTTSELSAERNVRNLSLSEKSGEMRRLGPLRILVVDDVASNRKLIARLARNRHHLVDEAQDGRDAIDKVLRSIESNNHYDTILMDYEMPILNGPDAVKEIRRLGCDSFIVGVTGNVLSEDVNYFMACGADSVMPKPVKFKCLEDMWFQSGITG